YSGTITWFEQSWSALYPSPGTACTERYPPVNDNLFAALSFKFLSDTTSILNSNVCGKCIRMWKDDKSVVVTIVDVMMRDNASPEDVDLATSAFTVFADEAVGVVRGVNWEFVDCVTGGTPSKPPQAQVTVDNVASASVTTAVPVFASVSSSVVPETNLFENSATSAMFSLSLSLAIAFFM
ncbi:hypothetical protein BDR26DRAFT_850861, partial [Obelidium mucronatum]